jgi:hypothetical protein
LLLQIRTRAVRMELKQDVAAHFLAHHDGFRNRWSRAPPLSSSSHATSSFRIRRLLGHTSPLG